MRLYVDAQFASPYALCVYVALHTKGLDFDISTVDLDAGGNDGQEFSRLSLTRRVPTLEHSGFSLSESSAICEYLEQMVSGPALYPKDPQNKARARQIQAWLRSDLAALRAQRSTQILFYGPLTTPLSGEGQQAADKLIAIADALLPANAQNVLGPWCIVDVDLAVMLNRLVLNEDPVPERLASYACHQWQHPAVQSWVNRVRPPL